MNKIVSRSAVVLALSGAMLGVGAQSALASTDTSRPVAPVVAYDDAQGIKDRIISALRHGGPMLADLLSRFSPEAAKWVETNANKLADYLESSDWSYAAIKRFLVSNGCPEGIANMIALWLSSVAR